MSGENNFLEAFMAMFGISTLAAASRSALSEDRRTITAFMRGLVMATFSGCLVGLIIYDMEINPALKGAITGVAAFVADDLLMMILGMSGVISKRPKAFLELLLKLLGK